MSLINLFVAARSALAQRRQRQRAMGELASLDDRSLADIGLHRSQLPAFVEGLHEVVQLDAAPVAVLSPLTHRDAGLPLSEQWLRRV